VAGFGDDGPMLADGRPILTQVDYQCLFGGGSSITTTWFGSVESVDVVAAWYRRTLDGYVERASNDWVRQRSTGTDLVVVAAAGQWPEGTPAPTHGWSAQFRTLVMQSSIMSGVGADQASRSQPHRPRRWLRLPSFLRRRPG